MKVSHSLSIADRRGISSGFLYIDTAGTANGSVFTITVADSEPHFFYMTTGSYLRACRTIAVWSIFFKYNPEWDIIFALNPVT